jgi:HAD superfamily hydrolase (TIGR01509 family)
MPGIRVFDGAVELVESLHRAGIKIAIVSTAIRAEVERFVELRDLGAYVDAVVGAGEAGRNKPFPDPYLRACELLGVRPDQAVAVEDTEGGAKSATAAGCAAVYGVPFTGFREELLAIPVTQMVESLPELGELLMSRIEK